MFGSPWMLLGLGAAAFIALAHRLFRQPAPEIKLASIRFLPKRDQEPVRAHRWQDLPLMALRLLIWATLAIALASPACPVERNIDVYQAPQAAFIVLQADARSHHIVAQKNLWQHAIARAKVLIDALPPGSSIHLSALDARFHQSFAGTDKGKAKATLRSWAKDSGEQDLVRHAQLPLSAIFPTLSQAAMRGPQGLPAVGYYVGEAHGPNAVCPDHGTAGMSEWICLSPTEKQPSDPASPQLAITDLEVLSKPNQSEPTLELVAKMQSFGPQNPPSAPLELSWYIDGEQRQTQTIRLQDKRATASWYYGIKDDKPHRVRVELRGKDSFPLDDHQERWIAKRKALRVLLVDGDPSEQRENDEVFLLAKALEQAFPKQGVLIRGTDPSQFNALLGSSKNTRPDYDVIVLANVSTLHAKQSQVLESWVKQGLGLWITAGSRINAEQYNKRLDALLPLRLRSTSAAHEGSLGLSPPDTQHPIFSADINATSLDGGQTRRMFLLEPDPRRDASVALRFANGAPALVTRRVKQGRVLWWSTSIDRAWTDIVLHPGFVPLSRAIIDWLAHGQDRKAQSTDAQGMVGLPRKLSPRQRIKVQGPKQLHTVDAGDDFVPERIGLYQGTSSGAKATHHFAATLDPSASPPPSGAKHAPRPQTRAKRSGVRSYLPIWPFLWPLAALALVAETLLRMLRLSR